MNTQILKKDGHHTDAAVGMGFLELSNGRLAEAAVWAKRLLESEVTKADAMTLHGDIAMLKGEFDTAVSHYREEEKQKPSRL